jgi:4-hydroxy-tetrahydrodipicolinate reductase
MSEQYGQYVVSHAKDFLNMRCGQPATYYLEEFHKIYNTVLSSKPSTQIFQYGKKDGFDSFKIGVIELMKSMQNSSNINIPLEHIYMTNGVTQNVQLFSSYFKSGYLTEKPVDVIYTEELTYFLMKNHFENIGIKVETFSFEKLDELERQLYFYNNPAFYIIPFCHNPTGKDVKTEYLRKFLEIVKDSIVLSDETYLFFRKNKLGNDSLYFYPNKNIISMHTFSKIMAPGLRLGFFLTKNTDILKKLDDGGFMDSGGSVNPVNAWYVSQIIKEESYFKYFSKMVEDLTIKMNFVQKEFDKYPDYFEYEKPDGGYFLFFKTKKIKGKDFEEITHNAKLSFHNANKFGKNPIFNDNYYRLSISYYNLDDLQNYFPDRLKNLVELIDNKISKLSNINIWCLGYRGRLGYLIMEELVKLEKYSKNIYGLGRDNLSQILESNKIQSNDIIIDVSSPEGLSNLLEGLLRNKNYPRIITGTTGTTIAIEKLIETYGNFGTIIVKSNFSRGIYSILNCLKSFDKDYWDITIDETHHINKKDSPSGTALTIQKQLNEVTSKPININSVRTKDIIGFHAITFKTPTETVSIIHDVSDRRVFAVGCVKLIENIQNLNNGVYYNNV